MDVVTVYCARNVNPQLGYTVRRVYSGSEAFLFHRHHDYYEFFIPTTDGVCHLINGQRQLLPAHSLVLIRPGDTHSYIKDGKDFSFVNIAFSADTMEKLHAYYDPGDTDIFTSALPPLIFLSDRDYSRIMRRLDSLNTIDLQDIDAKRKKMKMILAEIYLYFLDARAEKDVAALPLWLADLVDSAKDPKNMTMTLDDMAARSGMTREHIARSFQKHLHTTTTAFMLDQKLNYGANMLLNTDLPILDICYECGFQTPCWFYRKFKEKFGVTPKDFRKRAEL